MPPFKSNTVLDHMRLQCFAFFLLALKNVLPPPFDLYCNVLPVFNPCIRGIKQTTAWHFYLEDPFYLGNDALFFESDVSYVLYGNNHVTIVYWPRGWGRRGPHNLCPKFWHPGFLIADLRETVHSYDQPITLFSQSQHADFSHDVGFSVHCTVWPWAAFSLDHKNKVQL